MNVSDFVWHRLNEWGLKRVYGYPGDGVGGLDVALEHAKDKMEYVQVRNEEMAAFMACAPPQETRHGRVCLGTPRPGAPPLPTEPHHPQRDPQPRGAVVRPAAGSHPSRDHHA